jgi:hypothetical protein
MGFLAIRAPLPATSSHYTSLFVIFPAPFPYAGMQGKTGLPRKSAQSRHGKGSA